MLGRLSRLLRLDRVRAACDSTEAATTETKVEVDSIRGASLVSARDVLLEDRRVTTAALDDASLVDSEGRREGPVALAIVDEDFVAEDCIELDIALY